MTRALAALSFALVTGCLDVGQQSVSLSLQLAGKPPGGTIDAAAGWSVEVERADLAFGPFYLCAGYQAGALCEDARGEWLSSAVVNALDEEAYEVGWLTGVTGSAQSWMYDLGITSLLTKPVPVVLPGAESLGGNSVLLEGIARKPPHEIPFRIEIPIQQEEGAEIGVCVVRKSSTDRFGHELSKDDVALVVHFDPTAWFRDLAFEELLGEASCPSGGCVERARFAPGSQSHRALRSALIAGERPEFEWITAP